MRYADLGGGCGLNDCSNVDEMSVPTRMQWPENRYNGILVVSDDEDEDEDD